MFLRETAARLVAGAGGQNGAVGGRAEPARKGFAFERREIPAELKVWNGEHFSTNPALTVLDLTDVPGER